MDGFEVASAAEAGAARDALVAAGRRPRLLAAGPAKTSALLAALLDAGMEVVHVESPLELARLSALADARGHTVRVGLRVNPTTVQLRGTLAMSGRPAPFGVPEPDVPAVLALARSLPGLDVVGFHIHAVCGNRDARTHAAYVGWCLDWAARTAIEHRVDLRWVDIGGGLGVAYGGETPLDVDLLGEELGRLSPPTGVEVALEPGRWLVADCGWYAAEIVDVKQSYGTTYVVVRGGIGGFALPAAEDFPFALSVLPVERWSVGLPRSEARHTAVTVAGDSARRRTSWSAISSSTGVRAGDLVVLPQAGAYGCEFALQSFLGPPATRHVVAPRRSAAPPACPVVITHTKSDVAVGIAYPPASRIARDDAAALGDRDDPYGGMGRNGAQHTPEVSTAETVLRTAGDDTPYAFSPGSVYNLRADGVIAHHGDVTSAPVVHAVVQAMRAS